MPRYEVQLGVNVREYHQVEVDAPDEATAETIALRLWTDDNGAFEKCEDQWYEEADIPDLDVLHVTLVLTDDDEDDDEGDGEGDGP